MATDNGKVYVKSWEQTFPWLRYDLENKVMFCTSCEAGKSKGMKTSSKNNFASGGNNNFRKSTLMRHEQTGDHKRLRVLIKTYPQVNPFETALKRQRLQLADRHRPAVYTAFHVAYKLARNERPVANFEEEIK